MKKTIIRHFNRRTQMEPHLNVLKIDAFTFRINESDPFDNRYYPGVVIKTKLNKEGLHETIKFIKPDAKAESFLLSIDQNMNDLGVLFDELVKLGGHAQIDMGGIVTLTIPNDFPYDIDQVIKDYGIKVSRFL